MKNDSNISHADSGYPEDSPEDFSPIGTHSFRKQLCGTKSWVWTRLPRKPLGGQTFLNANGRWGW